MPDEVRTPWPGGPPWMSRRARLIVPVVLCLIVQVPASVWGALRVGGVEPWRAALHVTLDVAGPLALLAARRFPGPVVTLVAALAVTDVLTTPVYGPPFIALGVAIVAAMVRGAAVWAAASVVVGWALVLLVASFGGREWRPPLVVAATIGLAVCFGAGAFVRGRRIRFAAMKEESARQRQSAEERERLRIARELHDVLRLVGIGLTNDEIAERLFLSPLTAKTHVSRIMAKLQARDRVHLVVVAYETGLVTPGWQ